MDLLSTIETRIEKLERKISKRSVTNQTKEVKPQKTAHGSDGDCPTLEDRIQKQKSLNKKVISNLYHLRFFGYIN